MKKLITSVLAFVPVLLVGFAAPGARAFTPRYHGQVGTSARLVPLGFSVHGTGTAGTLLWGENTAGNPFYGFARVSLRAQSSITVNGGTARIDLFPIAFLGLSAGYNPARRSANTSSVDCGPIVCQGWVRRGWVQAAGVLGAGSAFVGYSARLTSTDTSIESAPHYDEDASLVAKAGGDTFVSFEIAPGVNLTPQHRAGLFASYDRMRGTDQTADAFQVFYSYRWGDGFAHNVNTGGGVYRSSLEERAFTLYVSYSYSWGHSLSLF